MADSGERLHTVRHGRPDALTSSRSCQRQRRHQDGSNEHHKPCVRHWPICCSTSETRIGEDVMPKFYFEQLLQTGLNGIDQQGITAAVLQIAGVILILSLLWSVYEAYSNGGDVRLLGVAAVKYLVLGLVFLNYQSAFRAVNSMFNGVADGIYSLSGEPMSSRRGEIA